jgi:hypothetical protein
MLTTQGMTQTHMVVKAQKAKEKVPKIGQNDNKKTAAKSCFWATGQA